MSEWIMPVLATPCDWSDIVTDIESRGVEAIGSISRGNRDHYGHVLS